MHTDMEEEMEVKPELLLEDETEDFTVYNRLYENIKIENEDSREGTGLQEEGNTVKTQKEIESSRNKFRYEEELDIEANNQASDPVPSKGSKTVKRVSQRSVGARRTQKPRAREPLTERGDTPGLSLKNTDMSHAEASSDAELMWNTSQEDTNDEEQFVKYTRAMESAAEQSDEHAEPTPHSIEEEKSEEKRSPVKRKTKKQASKRQPQIQRLLLPDAPPRKRTRGPSPHRVQCRLSAGTPTIPHAPELQPWELRKMQKEQDRAAQSVASGTNLLTKEDVAREASQHLNKILLDEDSEDDVMDDGDDPEERHEIVRSQAVEPTDFARLDVPYVEELNTAELEWLSHEDVANDVLLTDLLRTTDTANDDQLTFDWSDDFNAFRGRREVFTGTPGPTIPVDTSTRPIDIFLKYFDTELLDMIVRETNRYAATMLNDTTMATLKLRSRIRKWTDTDRSEIAVFLAVLMYQGLEPKPVEKHYWEERGCLTTPYFKQVMTYDRFILLKKMLHFANDDDANRLTNYDDRKLRKIWPVLDFLNKKFSTLYLPGRDVVIDESLLKWQGRLGFAQKIANKAAKVGLKSYELCESTTGYLWKFFVYTGKSQTHTEGLDQGTELASEKTERQADVETDVEIDRQTDGLAASSAPPPPPPNATAHIVFDLANPLFNLGHTIIMDNFYNSPLLARYLKTQGTDCYGTLRLNREFVPEIVKSVAKSDMRIGEVLHSFCKDVNVMVWRDTNVVSMISSFHKGEIGGKEKYGRYKYKPEVVLDYNLSMGGVDKKDQLLSAYPIERVRNLVWYKKVFRRMVNVTILNSYIIYRTEPSRRKTLQRIFRTSLADEIIATFKPPVVERPITRVVVKSLVPGGFAKPLRPILQGNHFVGEGATKFKKCVFCRQSRSRYVCKQCNVTLCLLVCFERYHTQRGEH